jgi:hypothetical protein
VQKPVLERAAKEGRMTVMKLRRRVPSKLRRRYGHFPTLARLKNSAKIMAYVRDPTHGPHVHVAYEGNEGNPTRLRIADGKAIGPITVKRKDLKAAREWLRDNREFALAEWRRLNPNDREP